MKAIKFSLFTVSLAAMFFTSCKKTPEAAPQAESATKLYERTMQVYDADKSNSATLRFRSSSKDLLVNMALDKFEFTLVTAPAPIDGISTDPDNSTSNGKANISENNISRKLSGINEIRGADNVVFVDLMTKVKATSVSVIVKKKALANNFKNSAKPSEETLYPTGTSVFFIGGNGWHRVQINNLSYNALNVAFFYNSCDGYTCQSNGDLKGTFTRYSGYSFTLYLHGWAWYYNCNRSVGALITIAPYTGYHFSWTLWSRCIP